MKSTWLTLVLLLGVFLVPSPVAAVNTVTKTNDGTVVVDGKPTFLLGFYSAETLPKSLPMLEEFAAAKFNFLYSFTGYDTALLDSALSKKIYVMPHNDSFDKNLKHPAVIGWGVKDDINGPWENPTYSPADLARMAQPIVAAFPKLMTYSSGGGNMHYQVCNYVDSALFSMGLQQYPVSNPTSPFENGVDMVVNSTWFHRRQCPQSTLIANLQAFSWADYNREGRFPTALETRQMFYGSLSNNVNGILPFIYRDMPVKHPDVWQEWKKLGQDFSIIEPFVTDGVWTKYDSQPWEIVPGAEWRTFVNGKSRVYGGIWTKDNQSLVILINSSNTKKMPVNLSNTAFQGKQLSPVFTDPRYGSGLQIQGQSIIGELDPDKAHVYIAKSATSCNEDINQDGEVNLLDFSLLSSNFFKANFSPARVDINRDGNVNVLDFSLLSGKFFKKC